MRCAVKILDDLNKGIQEITYKAIKKKGTFVLVIYNSRLKPKILKEMIVKHYLIIAYHMQ